MFCREVLTRVVRLPACFSCLLCVLSGRPRTGGRAEGRQLRGLLPQQLKGHAAHLAVPARAAVQPVCPLPAAGAVRGHRQRVREGLHRCHGFGGGREGGGYGRVATPADPTTRRPNHVLRVSRGIRFFFFFCRVCVRLCHLNKL